MLDEGHESDAIMRTRYPVKTDLVILGEGDVASTTREGWEKDEGEGKTRGSFFHGGSRSACGRKKEKKNAPSGLEFPRKRREMKTLWGKRVWRKTEFPRKKLDK